MEKYPFQDLQTPELPGERWKDVPEQEGRYQVSNLGRVRMIPHIRVDAVGRPRRTEGKLVYQRLRSNPCATTRGWRTFPMFLITGKNKPTSMVTARMVYYCFVAPFDYRDKGIFVLYRDDNPLNNVAENLLIGNGSDRRKHMAAAGRLPRSNRPKRQAPEKPEADKGPKPRRFPISRYDLDGNLICTYPNSIEAGKAMGIHAGVIRKAAMNKGAYTSGGFIWRRGDAPKAQLPDLSAIKHLANSRLSMHGEPISQYDATGKLINTFPSSTAAALHFGSHSNANIRAILRGDRITWLGFVWRQGTAPQIDPRKGLSPSALSNSALTVEERVVSQYNLDGIRVRTYANAKTAARETGFKPSAIRLALCGTNICAHGFLWNYGRAYRIDLSPYRKRPGIHLSPLGKHLKAKRLANLAKRTGKPDDHAAGGFDA